MTTDSALSTADPDRIYVVVDRVVYSIHISSQKRETVAHITFEPKCLAAGYGWIGIGGSDNGECAFVRLPDRSGVRTSGSSSDAQGADVDSALPIDLETSTRSLSQASVETGDTTLGSGRNQLPEVQLHKFGGSIVNSVTIHRLPGDDKVLADEIVAILSNNDKSVTIYSLTQSKTLKVLHHSACMNFAIISPDSSILAAVGDETHAYFYDVTRNPNSVVLTETGEKLCEWKWDLLRSIEMDIGSRVDDKCCFTIAFSQFSRLCAVGSQSGVITVFDVRTIRDLVREPHGKASIICYFNSSRSCCNGGAVRCMAFAPEPWDLLVWLEDKGRAGVADVRRAFVRRQILQLDMTESGMEEVATEALIDESTVLGFDLDGQISSELRHDLDARTILDSVEGSSGDRTGEGSETSPLRESLIQDLTERERLIVEFLNTARWTSRLEDGLTDRRNRTNVNSRSHPIPRPRLQGSTDGSNRASRPTSPPPVILSQSNHEARNRTPDAGNSTPDPQPSITLSWTTSPAELQSATLDNPSHAADSSSSDQSSSSNESGTTSRPRGTVSRPSASFYYSNAASDLLPRPRNHQRSRSSHRRTERQDGGLDTSHDQPRLNSELRANILAVERLRRQRQIINDAHNRNNQREQRYRQQSLGFDHTRSPRWIRTALNELPDRSFGVGHRDQDPSSTAGLGWGADGRTLYVATVDGIFEYQLDIRDRKTFPGVNYR
ncbi:hypothetical protein P175DRAFT_0494840 [Aspergillus ochraceoroseus IBT 24754]|uniref:DUF2415 domain-containing protein n=1 Tax=Aspergillus ochraceoroseus IBT 24754 TaxID=1392256 RepID=A0A2T5LQA5_9EURO|nr:uncharacterized protein P175DRAFT_0494840 [Aspergillus ochraceoroseus IBT 24754]PTU18460.1 hypothetical protein P175DRAFT_0494840 [Aspergillus ochraceoroseus IBT 24754]